jgi:hypothetical protein
MDLLRLGVALWLRWQWLHRTDPSRPWAFMPLSLDGQARAFFKVSVRCMVGDGVAILFWTDPWIHGKSIVEVAPELFQVVHAWRRGRRTVASTLTNDACIQDIVGPLTVQVLTQYLHIR